MIITTYTKDGKKIRKPVGYTGQNCSVATAPYEAREIKGQTTKKDTPDALEPEPQAVEQQIQANGG